MAAKCTERNCGAERAAGKEAGMYANPKETTSLRLDGTMKRRSKELPALHGMTLTEAFKAGGKTAVTSVKIPKDVAGEMESVLKGLGTDFSQAVRLLTLQTTALGGMPFAAGIRRKAS